MIPVIGPDDIRPHLSIGALIPTAAAAFRAISEGTTQAPVYVLHPNDVADIHVKSATLSGCPIFTVKMAGWSQVLVDRGEPASSGIIAVFDSETCRPLAILQDDHLISDYRTAAAGAFAVQQLAPESASTALILGTGTQARLQAEALNSVRRIKELRIWGRSSHKAAALVQDLRAAFPDMMVDLADDLREAVRTAEIIVAATGSKRPLIQADWVQPHHLILSVGSDEATKCEIDPAILPAARVVVDALASATKYGTTDSGRLLLRCFIKV